MISAAVAAAGSIEITGVTILTSLAEGDLSEIGFQPDTKKRAIQLAKLAIDNGAKAIVCSPLEIEGIRAVIPKDISIITPGIRPKNLSNSDDQKRIMDPSSAIAAGANYLVIGRPITGLWSDGSEAMKKIAAEIRESI